MTDAQHLDWPQAGRMQRSALIAGGVGLALCALGAIWDIDQFFHSYLYASFSWLAIGLGSLAILMVQHLTGGTWGLVLRRILEAATRTLPLMLVLFLPLAFGLEHIYPWAGSGESHVPPEQARYFQLPFFFVRAGTYFAVWLAIALLLNRWSDLEDRSADPKIAERTQQFSGPGLILYGLTVTFAAVDWIMSLQAEWYSTIFGVLVAIGQMLLALALAIAVATWLMPRTSLGETTAPTVWNDLGNLLLAFVMLWSYMTFSQFLVIWSGNLPEEITWYVIRSEGGWQWIAVALAIFYFALPFVLLLSRDVKRRPERLRVIALAVFGMSFVHQHWLIAPPFSPRQFRLHWMDLAALVGVGGLWLALFLRGLRARPLIPLHDPQDLAEVMHHA